MDHWHLDSVAEARREEMPTAPLGSDGWIARRIYEFANWMNFTGSQLRWRYEDPVRCAEVHTRDYAHQRVWEKTCNHP